MSRVAALPATVTAVATVAWWPTEDDSEIPARNCELDLVGGGRGNEIATAMSASLDAHGTAFIKMPGASGDPYDISIGPAADEKRAAELHALAVAAGAAAGRVDPHELSRCVALTITESEPFSRGAPLPP